MRIPTPIAAAAILWLTAIPTRADVTFNESVTVSGPATIAGGGVFESVIQIAGDSQASKTEAKAGTLFPQLVKTGAAAPLELVLLEEKKVFRIDPAGLTIHEENFEERHRRAIGLVKKRGAVFDYRDVAFETAPGAHGIIENFECDQLLLTVTGNLVDPATKSSRPLMVRADVWYTTSFNGKSEIQEFRKKYSAGLGLDAMAVRWQAFTAPRYAEVMREFMKALGTVSGFPVQVSATLSGYGLGPGPAQPSPRASAPASGDPSVPGGDAEAATGFPGRPPSGTISGAPGGPRGMIGSVALPTGAALRSRIEASAESQTVPVPLAPELNLTWRVTAVKTTGIDPSAFTLPEGYRRFVPKSRAVAASPDGEGDSSASAPPVPKPS